MRIAESYANALAHSATGCAGFAARGVNGTYTEPHEQFLDSMQVNEGKAILAPQLLLEGSSIRSTVAARRFRGAGERARERLRWLHAATSLTDLAAIRGNRLEALKGGQAGQHSTRINDRWRICFSWRVGSAHDVEIVDYH